VAKGSEQGRRISVELSDTVLTRIDELRRAWGHRSRGPVVEQLLLMVLSQEGDRLDGDGGDTDAIEPPPTPEEAPEASAMVPVSIAALEAPLPGATADSDHVPPWPEEAAAGRPGGGIDLPGFVRRRTREVRQSLAAEGSDALAGERTAVMNADQLRSCLGAVRDHWLELYGQSPQSPVVDGAVQWLAHDIWPAAEASGGQPFDWGALERVLEGLAPAWTRGAPSLERVLVAAGLLEDPFGAATLRLRIPSLVGRLVQRLRRRRRGSPFLDLGSTLTIQGSLRLLQLPTDPDHVLTLHQIREAYRQLALAHHPDTGGDPEAMRRLNEAYQLLKQRVLSRIR
jgi:DnaJ domain